MVKLFYSHFGRNRYFTISRRYILKQRMIHLVFKRRTKCYNSKTYRYCNTVFSTMESTCWQGRGPMSIGDPLTVTRGGGNGVYKKLALRYITNCWKGQRKLIWFDLNDEKYPTKGHLGLSSCWVCLADVPKVGRTHFFRFSSDEVVFWRQGSTASSLPTSTSIRALSSRGWRHQGFSSTRQPWSKVFDFHSGPCLERPLSDVQISFRAQPTWSSGFQWWSMPKKKDNLNRYVQFKW